MRRITASKLYNFIQCEHRVWRDEYGPKEEKIQETTQQTEEQIDAVKEKFKSIANKPEENN